MTDEEKRQLKNFDGKVRQLLQNYRVMQKENADLYIEMDRKDEEIARLKAELRQSQSDYSNLKLAALPRSQPTFPVLHCKTSCHALPSEYRPESRIKYRVLSHKA